ncbi:MAG: mercuric transporter MerT family protein [Acidiphilium sp.]|nr:mercuric transporter MerT family protein [Acidiphilium sp.]MDD4936149.1 mercuric transporter MerT family protein [Acidiphilium sp.]
MSDRQIQARHGDAVGTGSAVLTIGGLIAAFGAASCCGLPFLLAMVGLGSGWLGGIGILAAPDRPILLLIASLGLGAGALMFAWQQRPPACAGDNFCARPQVRWAMAVGFVLGFGLLYLGYRFG